MSTRLERMQEKMRKLQGRRSTFWKPEEGQNHLRILPWEDDDFYLEAKTHFVPGAGERGRGQLVRCMDDQACPLCKATDQLAKSSDEEEREIARRLQSTYVYYMNIVDLKNPDAGTQVWRTYATTLVLDLVAISCDPDWGNFADLRSGRNLTLSMEKKGNSPSYTATFKPKQSKIEKSYMDEIKDLSTLVPTTSRSVLKELAKLVVSDKGEESEDYEEALSRRRKTSKKRKKSI